MSVLIVGNEKNFAALRPRLFTGSLSSKAAGQVSAAIEAANPGVDLGRLVPGTVLDIPDDLPAVSGTEAVAFDPASRQAIAAILDAGAATIDGLAAVAKAQQEADAAARKPVAAALGSAALRTLRRKDASLGPRITAAQKALAAADAADQERQVALAGAQAQWQEELGALSALVELG
ncbi:MAG TPA: hypothetical protein VG388_03840 [Solirubrobacteraceae bacterium]|jgi:hypothetical protein|nr:hypothetical protein [Solirubrobacteraceae bacterium]